MKPSGIRLGSPACTTRGMNEADFRQIGRWIADALHHRTEPDSLARIRRQVKELADAHPLYPERRAKASALAGV
jgi:glycine hydroxymethyltransferase